MKKINNKGFMLAELLAVTVVILIIFSAIYVNFYPTMGEYENRISYNDIDSVYANYYFKVFLLKYFDTNSSDETSSLTEVDANSYKTIVSYNSTSGKAECLTNYTYTNEDGTIFTCSSLIEKYNIEEVILTKYETTDLKSKDYSGLLKNYIQAMPKYINEDTNLSKLYRIIIKTKTGYANDQFYAKVFGQGTYTAWSTWQIKNSCTPSDICQAESKKVNDYDNGSLKPTGCDDNPLCYKPGTYHLITYPCYENCTDLILYRTRSLKSNLDSWAVSPER